MHFHDKAWFALDCPVEQALAIAEKIARHDVIRGFKLNSTCDELMYRKDGALHVMEKLSEYGKPIWPDLKLHDVPATVARRVAAHVQGGLASFITVMAKGEVDMMMAAVGAGDPTVSIIAVTELTSSTAEQIDLGSGHSAKASVVNLARNAVLAKVPYLVCSAEELPIIVKRPELESLTPFIPGLKVGEVVGPGQSRVGTITNVLEAHQDAAGVFGTAFIQSNDPWGVAQQLAEVISAIPER